MRFLGVVLVGLGLLGLARGLTASVSHVLYFTLKFGACAESSPEQVDRLAGLAHAFDPLNSRLCALAAIRAWDGRLDAQGREQESRVERAAFWCDRALRLNPYPSSVRLLKAWLLSRRSAREGAAYWQAYVDWDFWDPSYHAILVDLHVTAGDLDAAVSALRWVAGSPHEALARERVADAWRREQQMPPSAGAREP